MKTCISILTLLAAAPLPEPAWGHATLRAAAPAPDSTVRAGPREISLQFTAPVLARFTTVRVSGPDGRFLPVGPVKASSKDGVGVVAPLRGAGAPGLYRVQWTAAAKDMHKMGGAYSFTVRP